MSIPPVVTYICVPVLVGFSGLFSGLTLGLLGLDPKGLDIVAKAGSASDAACAKKIAPIRARGNLLLCTLLLGNTAVNAALSVLMADLTSGVVGIVVSTVVIVIFGEIVPQSCCSRYALQIGAASVPIVQVLIVLMLPISFPLAFLLDLALGEELGTIHSRAELSELIRMEQQAGILEAGAARVVHGALRLWDTPVKELMTPTEDTYMLDSASKLDFEKKAEIHKKGFSRVPVINAQKQIEGILLARDLAVVNKKDLVPVGTFTKEFNRKLVQVGPDLTVGSAMQVFNNFSTHLVVVVKEMPKVQEKQPKGANHHVARVGKKCLESMATSDAIPLENVLGVLSFDDCASAVFSATHDEKEKGEQDTPAPEAPADVMKSPSKMRRLPAWGVVMPHFCESQTDTSDSSGSEFLSDHEASALAQHLRSYHPKVPWPDAPTLTQVLCKSPVSCLRRSGPVKAPPEGTDRLYTSGEPLQRCVVTLCGKVRVTCGKDHLRFHRGSFGVLGVAALMNPDDVADFSAYMASAELRCLQLKKDDVFPGGVPSSPSPATDTGKRSSIQDKMLLFKREQSSVPAAKTATE